MGFLRRLFPNPERQFQELRREQAALQSVIGFWPPRIRNAGEAREVLNRWKNAIERAEKLHHQDPGDIDRMVVFADLLRMGHNINVPGAALTCYQIFMDVLRRNPNCLEAHFKFALFCLSGGGAPDAASLPKQAALAEAHLLEARRLAGPIEDPEISQALGFACMYQKKWDDAIRHFEEYLARGGLAPNLPELLKRLRSGERPELIFSPGPGTGGEKPPERGESQADRDL